MHEIISHPDPGSVRVKLITQYEPAWPENVHGDLEMGLVLEGSVTVRCADRSGVLHRGDPYIVAPYTAHSMLAGSPGNRVVLFHIHPDLYRSIDRTLCDMSLPDFMPCSDTVRARCGALLRQSAAAYFAGEKWSRLRSTSLLLECLYLWLSNEKADTSKPRPAQRDLARMYVLTDYIARHHAEPVSLADLSRIDGTTQCHLSHLFRPCLGIGFQEYLNRVRLDHAVKLLLTTHLRLTDICVETGISGSRHLNEMMLKTYGCTAREFARNGGRTRLSDMDAPDLIQKAYTPQEAAQYFDSTRE